MNKKRRVNALRLCSRLRWGRNICWCLAISFMYITSHCSGNDFSQQISETKLNLAQKLVKTNADKPFAFLRCSDSKESDQQFQSQLQWRRDMAFVEKLHSAGDTVSCTHQEFIQYYPLAAPGLSSDNAVVFHVFVRKDLVYLTSASFAEGNLPSGNFFHEIETYALDHKKLRTNQPQEFLLKAWFLARSEQREKAKALLLSQDMQSLPANLQTYKTNLEKILSFNMLVSASEQITQ